jgi:two-component system, cell cycle sensor histidine kinase and response regulator CckA
LTRPTPPAGGRRERLRLLLIEDQENDSILLLRELDRLGYDVESVRVDTPDAVEEALGREWDLIISDYNLPQFDALDALEMCRARGIDMPFIIVSGSISEEEAVESMRRGAHDFITKARLARLGPAIERGRREYEARSAHRAAEARLRQAQKMEAVGQLAGGVAHDFNNLLAVIQGYGELLMKRLPEGDPNARRLEQILLAAGRGADLTRQLLAFSRQQPLQARTLDLNAIVAAIEPLLRRLVTEEIALVTVLDPALHRVKADPTQIDQVLMNLVINARDAMDAGGRLTIETANVELDAAYELAHPDAKAGAYAMLAVSDVGHGMSEETLARAFEPFFTTKEPGQGTGLGLATVYGIVRQSGGHVAVYSEPGHGATFKVYLPRTDQPAAVAAPAVPAAQMRGSETVVVIEDEPALRSAVHDMLQEGGYTVVDGETPEASLDAAAAHQGPVHLVLSDLVMPRISGADAVAYVRRRHPRARALYMSGYANAAAGHHSGLPEGHAFLQKPFSLEVLLRKVREVLDAPG